MDLALVFTVYLVQQIEPQDLFADSYFVSVLERGLSYTATVEKRTVTRIHIRQNIICTVGFGIRMGRHTSVPARNLCVINANVRLQSPSQNNLFTFERYRHRDQFAAQKNKRRPQIAAFYFGIVHTRRDRRETKSQYIE